MALLIIPNAAWVIHSHQFWQDYRMSLGVTNEGHIIGTDILFMRKYYQGFLSATTAFVTSYPGFITAIAGLWIVRKTSIARPLYTFAISLGFFYFTTLYTTGASWAFYYHSLSVPFVGILFGALAQVAASKLGYFNRQRSLALALGSSLCAGSAIGFALQLPTIYIIAAGLIAAGIAYTLTGLYDTVIRNREKRYQHKTLFGQEIVMTLLAVTLVALGARSLRLTPQAHNFVAWKACADEFAAKIPEDARIACWGSHSRSALDRIVAYNVPWMFFWMYKQGFSVPEDFQSVATIDSVAQLGAEYYVEFLPGAARTPGFHQALRERYAMLDSCGVHVLYSLK